MKNLNNQSILPRQYGVQEIKTKKELKNAAPYRMYFTYNYELFTKVGFNRGQSNGIERRRLKLHDNKYVTGDYHRYNSDCDVNCNGIILDGTHRFEMLMNHNEFIIFTINPDPRVNIDDLNELANILSANNSISPVWSANESFKSALAAGHSCALAIEGLIVESNNTYKFGGKFLTPMRIHEIGYGFITKSKDVKLNRELYCDDKLAAIMNSEEFKVVADYMMRFMKLIYDINPIIPFFVLRQFVSDMNKPHLEGTTLIYTIDWENVLTILTKYVKKNEKEIRGYNKNKTYDRIISKFLCDSIR